MVFEARFNAQCLADILSIPASKTLLRRHLSTLFADLIGIFRTSLSQYNSTEIRLRQRPRDVQAQARDPSAAGLRPTNGAEQGQTCEEELGPPTQSPPYRSQQWWRKPPFAGLVGHRHPQTHQVARFARISRLAALSHREAEPTAKAGPTSAATSTETVCLQDVQEHEPGSVGHIAHSVHVDLCRQSKALILMKSVYIKIKALKTHVLNGKNLIFYNLF